MKAHETILRHLLEGTKQFMVPLFQREYRWKQERWEILWNDLNELYDEEQPRPHFLGSIVTLPIEPVPAGISKFLLIDGQQRLTTLMVLLAVIRDRARLQGSELSEEIQEYYLCNKFKRSQLSYYKLLPTQVDQEPFFALIRGEGPPPSNHRLGEAYAFFARAIDRGNGNGQPYDLERLKSRIVDSLMVVSITTDTEENPYLIFESLNYKGEPLTQADLIRNYFFMRLAPEQPERQKEIYDELWLPMQQNLGESVLGEFIRHYLSKDGRLINRNALYRELKQRLDGEDEAEILEELRVLSRYAVYYHRFIDPQQEPSPQIRHRLERLRRWEASAAYPFLLNLYEDYRGGRLNEEDFCAILSDLESFLVRRYFCGLPTGPLNRFFAGLYSKIDRNRPLDSIREHFKTTGWPTDEEFQDAFMRYPLYARSGDRYRRCRFVLEALEQSYGHKEPIDPDALSIEHVMPQTLTEEWRAMLGEEAQRIHEVWLHTVGNLTLTGYNEDLSNLPFARKRERLLESHLELNKYFATVERWTEVEIQARAKALAERALQIWPRVQP